MKCRNWDLYAKDQIVLNQLYTTALGFEYMNISCRMWIEADGWMVDTNTPILRVNGYMLRSQSDIADFAFVLAIIVKFSLCLTPDIYRVLDQSFRKGVLVWRAAQKLRKSINLCINLKLHIQNAQVKFICLLTEILNGSAFVLSAIDNPSQRRYFPPVRRRMNSQVLIAAIFITFHRHIRVDMQRRTTLLLFALKLSQNHRSDLSLVSQWVF